MHDLWLRLRAMFFKNRVEQDLDDELDFQMRKNVQVGMTAAEARDQARLNFGRESAVKVECRDEQGIHPIETLRRDVRYALRGFRRTPAFALTVIATIGLRLAALALLTESPGIAQSRRGGRQSTSQAAGRDPALNAAVASFEGTLRAITKKDFTVDLDNGNTVEFKIGKKTEFYIGEKKVAAKDLAPEAIVKVEGSKDGFGVLTASKVIVKPPAP